LGEGSTRRAKSASKMESMTIGQAWHIWAGEGREHKGQYEESVNNPVSFSKEILKTEVAPPGGVGEARPGPFWM
jgi:hypothetical protein